MRDPRFRRWASTLAAPPGSGQDKYDLPMRAAVDMALEHVESAYVALHNAPASAALRAPDLPTVYGCLSQAAQLLAAMGRES